MAESDVGAESDEGVESNDGDDGDEEDKASVELATVDELLELRLGSSACFGPAFISRLAGTLPRHAVGRVAFLESERTYFSRVAVCFEANETSFPLLFLTDCRSFTLMRSAILNSLPVVIPEVTIKPMFSLESSTENLLKVATSAFGFALAMEGAKKPPAKLLGGPCCHVDAAVGHAADEVDDIPAEVCGHGLDDELDPGHGVGGA